MSSSQKGRGRGRGRGGFMPSGPLAQRGRGRGGGDSPQGSDRDNSPRGRGSGSRGRGQSSNSSEESPSAVYGEGAIPFPSEEVKKTEDEYLKVYGEKREELDNELGSAMMPYRPAYGSQGEEVILWANYFHLRFKETEELFKYEVVITDPRKRSSENNENDGKVTGRKAMHIFKAVIVQVRRKNKGSVFATDGKQKIVATTSLKQLPENIDCPGGQGDISHQYDLTISEQVIHVVNLATFLKNQAQTPGFMPSPSPDSKANGFPFHQDIIDAMGTITGHAPRASKSIVNVGRSRFFAKENAELSSKIGDTKILQISKGFSQSVRPATGRLLLNVNVTHSIFRPAGRISELFDRLPGKNQEKAQKLHRIVSKARIKYTPPPAKIGDPPRSPKEMTIAGLGRDTDRCSKKEDDPKFPSGKRFGDVHEVQFRLKKSSKNLATDTIPVQGLQGDKYYSVYDYFVRKYQYQPESRFPVVNVGRPTDPIYVPAERCELLGFDPIRCELSAKESEDVIEFAVKPPKDNATWISGPGRADVLKLTSDIALLNDFGIGIEAQLITVNGRQLSSPQLLYNTSSEREARISRTAESGSWNLRAETRAGQRFHTRCKPIHRWAWIFFSLNEEDRTRFKDCMENFKNCVAKLGVRIVNEAVHPNGTVIPYREGDSMEAIYGNIQTKIEKENLEFALVILPDTQADIYAAVKLVGDIKLGFHTVCVTADKFSQDIPRALGLYANLATKINLKFGGVNHAICNPYEPFERDKTMIVGYDVVHPTGRAGNVGGSESQVGLVASIGQEHGQWRSRYWTQAARQEILDSKLAEEFRDQLEFYQAEEGALPVNILIYRDGVSEGQYLQVLKEELPRIFAACGKVYEQAGKESPSITLVVSVKRHATRFFPTSSAKMESSTNIEAGTVVDRGVTQARCWDFYLKSHAALQGTARPTHYVVLHDEIFRPRHLKDPPKPVSASSAVAVGKSPADDLEAVTHQLCYLYGRATKAISICTPARYADIVCTRARLHASGLARLASRPGLTLKGKNEILGMPVHENLRDTMYWI